MSRATPRRLAPDDLPAARRLLAADAIPSHARALEYLDDAARATAEVRGLVVEDGNLYGLVLFGLVAGAEGAGALHALAAATPALASTLLGAALAALRTEGARFALAEVADDPRPDALPALLRAHGFVEEGRIDDFYRDGVPLLLLRRNLEG